MSSFSWPPQGSGSGGGTQDVNLIEVNGAPVNVGTGAAGSGTQRVAVSSDSSLASVGSITNPVTVIQPTAANLNATVAQPTAANLNATVVQATAANLNATVAQPTAANLNATVVQSSGANLHVNVDNFPGTQPVSGTVTANQGTSPWVENVSQFGGSAVMTGTGSSGLGIPRVTVANDSNILATQSGTWNITNVSGTISLPTGASTSANQTNGSQKTQVVDGSGTVTGPDQTISGTNYFPVVLDSSATPGSAIPARAALIAGSDGTNARAISTDASGHVNVNISSTTPVSGRSSVTFARHDYTSVNVTTAAYVQIIASTPSDSNEIEIFDSSGQTLVLALGGVGSEVDQFYINPGGNGQIDFHIPSGSRVSLKAVTATADHGYINLNLYS